MAKHERSTEEKLLAQVTILNILISQSPLVGGNRTQQDLAARLRKAGIHKDDIAAALGTSYAVVATSIKRAGKEST